MKFKEAMATLEQLGSEDCREVYRRHGAEEPLFGVRFSDLHRLRKEIGTDHKLAKSLWKSGNTDARALAAMICDPNAFQPAELDRWLKSTRYYMLVNLVSGIAANSKHVRTLCDHWRRGKDDFTLQAGWNLVALLAARDKTLPESWFEKRLEEIEEQIHEAPNRTRHAMNMALIGIGARTPLLRDQAVVAARRIGPIEVDHGETGCKTPEAGPYIRKMWARQGDAKTGGRTSRPGTGAAQKRPARPAATATPEHAETQAAKAAPATKHAARPNAKVRARPKAKARARPKPKARPKAKARPKPKARPQRPAAKSRSSAKSRPKAKARAQPKRGGRRPARKKPAARKPAPRRASRPPRAARKTGKKKRR